MDKSLKSKLIMLVALIVFIVFFVAVFGEKNLPVGIAVLLAAFMNIGNDLSYKPTLSFLKVLILLEVLGIVAFLNNPVTLFGCILTFLIVFATTFTSYHLFGNDVYMPFLMCYFMMMCSPIDIEQLPLRAMSLAFGAMLIVGLNILLNRKKTYNLSKETLKSLNDEIINACDLKLEGKEVSKENFKINNKFYRGLFSKFGYRYFPNSAQESLLNVVKSFQSIGIILSDFDLSKNELKYIKNVISNISDINSLKISDDFKIENDVMYLILLNFEIISNEIKNSNLENIGKIPDKDKFYKSIKPIIKRHFSFRSVKFTFAFKMALVLTLWEILSLCFNLPYSKWLYFATIPLMLPYVDDIAETAKTRIKGTTIGVFIFTVILLLLPNIPIAPNRLVLIVMFVCVVGLIFNLQIKLLLSIFTTIMSVMVSLMYISPSMAIPLKILWVIVAFAVAAVVNYGFLPYSLEKESKNNLKIRYYINRQSLDLIKSKCLNENNVDKTSLLVLSNIVRENIELTEETEEIFNIQNKITEISNFIATYMDVYDFSDETKDKIVDIIDNGAEIDYTSHVRERIILNSTKYVCNLFKKEQNLI